MTHLDTHDLTFIINIYKDQYRASQRASRLSPSEFSKRVQRELELANFVDPHEIDIADAAVLVASRARGFIS